MRNEAEPFTCDRRSNGSFNGKELDPSDGITNPAHKGNEDPSSERNHAQSPREFSSSAKLSDNVARKNKPKVRRDCKNTQNDPSDADATEDENEKEEHEEHEGEEDEDEDEDYVEYDQAKIEAVYANENGLATFVEPNQTPSNSMVDSSSVNDQSRMTSPSQSGMRSLREPPPYNFSTFQVLNTTPLQQNNSERNDPGLYIQPSPPNRFQEQSRVNTSVMGYQGAKYQQPFFGGDAPFLLHIWRPSSALDPRYSTPYGQIAASKKRRRNQSENNMTEAQESGRASSMSHSSNQIEIASTFSIPISNEVTNRSVFGTEFRDQGNHTAGVSHHDPNSELYRTRVEELNLRPVPVREDYTTHWDDRFPGTSRQIPISRPIYWHPQGPETDEAEASLPPEVYENCQLVAMNPIVERQIQARLLIRGNLSEMKRNWTLSEAKTGRRIVRFERRQTGIVINLFFTPICQKEYQSNMCAISCIWRKETQEYLVTSVDCILLLEMIINLKFSVEAKNRIRRNLEVCKPITISKSKPALEPFFRQIMTFPPPRPRNIEKDVKVFLWDNLAGALNKIVSKYSAPTSPKPPKSRQHD